MAQRLIIKAQNSDTAEIRVIGDIGCYEDNNSMDFTQRVDQLLQAGIKNVNCYISSGGGECFEAAEMKEQVKRFPGRKIAYLGALCASAATDFSLVFDEVIGCLQLMYMIHLPSCYTGGDVRNFKSTLNLLEILTNNYVKNYSKKTGLPEDQIRKMMEEETWMDAAKAKELGFIDDIQDLKEEEVGFEIYASIAKDRYKKMPASVAAKITTDIKPLDSMNKIKMLAILASASVVLPADATDTQIEAAFEKLAIDNKAMATELANEKTKTAKAKAKLLCDSLQASKKITAEEYPSVLEDATANYDVVERAYARVPSVTAASTSLGKTETGATASERADWDFDKWKKEDPKGLEKEHAEKSELFAKIYMAKFGKMPW